MSSVALDPLHQFVIERLVPIHIKTLDLSFTNSALAMLVAVSLLTMWMHLSLQKNSLVPSRAHMAVESLYSFVLDTARGALGDRDAKKYMHILFTIFLFIMGCNMVGLLPYMFTATSHLAVTGTLAISVFLGVTLLGIFKHGFSYLHLFVPSGLPWWVLPIVVVVEVVSYMARPLTHCVRLVANMVAGHVMMKVLASFVVMLGPIKGGFLPLTLMVAINALELLVAFLQAYVFTTMTCVYLKDALHPHH